MILPTRQSPQNSDDHSVLAQSLVDIAARGDATECANKRTIGTESVMTARGVTPDATERVGKWDMRIARGEATRESEQRWNDRVDALTAWLLSEWEREQAEPKGDSR